MNLEDPVQRSFHDEPEMRAKLTSTVACRDVDPDGYDVLFLAGGHGAAWDFPDDPWLAHLTRAIYENGGAVAAVCHGPAGLVNVRLSDGRLLIDGRRVSAFTNDEERAVGMLRVVPFLLADELTRRGATFVPGPSFLPHVVADERLVTGQNPASAGIVAVEAVRALSASALRT